MNIVAIIPARMGSTRFPGKPLAPILGVPMIGHVYMRTAMAESLSDCWVATCDQEIMHYVDSIGGKAVMTADTHERCSDRCAEAMLKIEEQTGKKIDIVVMVQGDEPFVTPDMVDAAVQAIKEGQAQGAGVACLMGTIETEKEFEDPNCIKVVVNNRNEAVYMSREPIPTRSRGCNKGPWLKQVCIIPYTRDYLLTFNNTAPSSLEIAESIDLNRCIQNGHVVQMALSPDRAISVDTPADLAYAETVMKNEDVLVKEYLDVVKSAVA
ncbi:MAG: 3-deoxy-manno-octulosonate cytidylyltransferase [Alphaproteobacteria bacterium CG_4_9_14_3_um_filter_47_13]|nr:MAG: 3-deoxy-manno-octulosonate cytidylyltransferase [Alphaproteobacteria bacterium CG_4_9_14_3_um_filter_47_13]